MAKRSSSASAPGIVGVVGLGIMGSALAARLIRARRHVVGYDVLASRRAAFTRAGGSARPRCGDIADAASIIVCSLPSADALRETAAALVPVIRRGTIILETSTLPIAVKEEARALLAKTGAVMLDCPLSGTGAQARSGDLVVYASGDRSAYRRAIPVIDAFARAQYYVGPFGAGSKMKFVANLLVAIHNVAAAEALVLAGRAGLDRRLTLQAIGDGAGMSRMLQVRGPMMAAGRYTPPTMKLSVWQKDMSVIGAFARELGSPTPLFSATRPLYAAALAEGREDQDTAAVCAVLESRAGQHAPARRRARR